MGLSKQTYGRPAVFDTTIDSTDVNSYIDIDLNKMKQTTVSENTLTGYPNDVVAITTKVKIGGSVIDIATTGENAQTIGQLIAQINTDLDSDGEASLIASEGRIRIKSSASGDVAIDKVEVGNLVTGLTGQGGESFQAEYLPGVTGGGACYRVSNVASASNPVDAALNIDVFDDSDPAQPYTTYKKVYDRERGTLLVMDDGTNEFVAGYKITALVVTY